MVTYADRDVHYLREQKEMLENQNRFLEGEFQRQLDKIVTEKNDQIGRLIHIIDQTCPPPTEYGDQVTDLTHSSGTRDCSVLRVSASVFKGNHDLLAQKFMQQNVELQRELETLRAKLEYTFKLLNDKLDQQSAANASSTVIQVAIEQMRHSDAKLQELQLKTSSQQEENDLLRYLVRHGSSSWRDEKDFDFHSMNEHPPSRHWTHRETYVSKVRKGNQLCLFDCNRCSIEGIHSFEHFFLWATMIRLNQFFSSVE